MSGADPVIVIGGGIAGLACAVGLSDAGIPVRLFEGADVPGGRASSCRDDATGDTVDIGPHVLTSEHRNMLALMERLGTRDDVLWQPEKFITLLDPQQVVAMRNFRLPAPLHFLPNFFRVERLSTADIYSARKLLLRVMRMNEADVLRFDEADAQQVIRALGVSERFIDWFWRTVCLAVMNVPLEQCSAGSLLRFMKMMSGRNDFHFGFPRVPLADLFVPGALKVIRTAGGEVRTATAVHSVCIDDGAVTGVRLEDGSRVGARQCVVAVPPAALWPLLPPAMPGSLLASRELFEPSPYISTYLWFTRKLTTERFWARTWSPRNINCDFYDLSNIRPDIGEGSLIACNCIHSANCSAWRDEEIIQGALRELADFAPGAMRNTLRHARVHRIAMAITAPHPGFERARPATRTPIAGLFLAGDWIRTALPESMESAVRAGFLAAEAVAAGNGHALEIALPSRSMEGLAGWINRAANRNAAGRAMEGFHAVRAAACRAFTGSRCRSPRSSGCRCPASAISGGSTDRV